MREEEAEPVELTVSETDTVGEGDEVDELEDEPVLEDVAEPVELTVPEVDTVTVGDEVAELEEVLEPVELEEDVGDGMAEGVAACDAERSQLHIAC